MTARTASIALLVVALFSSLAPVSQGATFTWLGGNDLDWDNAANWLGGIVPAQSDMGARSGGPWNTIIFSGSTMPTSNVKDLGYNNYYNYTSVLQLDSGGSLSMGLQSLDNGLSTELSPKTMLVIGDGVSGGTDDVTLQFTESVILARHPAGVFTTIVNQDGALDVVGTLTLSYHNTRDTVLDIIGGRVTADSLRLLSSSAASGLNDESRIGLSAGASMIIDGTVTRTMLSLDDSGVVVRFQDESYAYFMAQYGGDLPNLATVEGALGTLFVSDTDWTLVAEDVDGEYFKVSAVPEPSTLASCLLGLACLLIRRRRR